MNAYAHTSCVHVLTDGRKRGIYTWFDVNTSVCPYSNVPLVDKMVCFPHALYTTMKLSEKK